MGAWPTRRLNPCMPGPARMVTRLRLRMTGSIAKSLVRWATGKKVNQWATQTKPYNNLPPWNGGIFGFGLDIRVDLSPTLGLNVRGPRESYRNSTPPSFAFCCHPALPFVHAHVQRTRCCDEDYRLKTGIPRTKALYDHRNVLVI